MMSDATPPRPRKPRRFDPGTVLPALLITLLLHALLYERARLWVFVTPEGLSPAPLRLEKNPANKPIPPSLLPPDMRPEPPKFVITNPLAPAQKPERKDRVGVADQKAAQPTPVPGARGDKAKIDGEKNSERVANGVPRELLPPHLQPEPGRPISKPAPEPENPIAKNDPKTPAPPAVPGKPSEAKKGPLFADKTSPKKADAKGNKIGETTPKTSLAESDEPEPKPRPKATIAGTTGLLGTTSPGAANAGAPAADARFTAMGEYTGRMLEIIEHGWHIYNDRTQVIERGTVVITFTLNKDGTVSDARIDHATTSERVAAICLASVTARAPYGEWPQDMIEAFGDKQEGSITFRYL